MTKKTYRICGFDCAACAANAERHLNKHEKIEKAIIDVSQDKLFVTYKEEEMTIDELLLSIKEVEEDEIEISENTANKQKTKIFNKDFYIMCGRILFTIIVALVALLAFNTDEYYWVAFGLYLAGLVVIVYDIFWRVIHKIIHLKNPISENLLIVMAAAGAFIIAVVTKETHNYLESLMVVTLFQIGQIIENIATTKSKQSISSAVELRVEKANLVVNDQIIEVSPEDLNIDDVVIVSAGELIPTDGEVIEGNALIDTSSLTGEFVPVQSFKGLEVFSGCIIKEGSLKLKVIRRYENSAVAKVFELISNSGASKSKADEFVTKFARFYTPIVFFVSVLVGVIGGAITKDWSNWIILGLKMLVVACPCAIVISVPLAYFSAIGLSSKNGIVVKGGNYLDRILELKKFVTDKTGTLTKGNFVITKIVPEGMEKEKFLDYLCSVESLSNHPVGKAISSSRENNNRSLIVNFTEYAGLGVAGEYNDSLVIAGNKKFMIQNGISIPEIEENGVVTYLVIDEKYAGYVVLNDEIKEESKTLMESLKKQKIETYLLSGDKESNTSAVCKELGIDKYYAELMPSDKINILEEIMADKKPTAFLGDGVNDAACIKRADVGFAMGALGSDAAVENADIIIMNDDPNKVYDAYKIAKIARHTSLFNIIFALFIKFSIEIVALVTHLLGHGEIIPMWAAVLADTGLTVVLVINSFLLLYRKIDGNVVK